MADELLQSLETIRRCQKKMGRIVPQLLRPGLSRDQIASLEPQFGLRFPPSLIELYTWHDGTDSSRHTLGELWFIPGQMFYSMEESIKGFGSDAPWWDRKGFTFFNDPGFQYYMVECSTKRPMEGRIITGCDGETSVIHRNLHIFFKTQAACFEEGAYFVTADKQHFEVNAKLELEIAMKLNSEVPYWKNEYARHLEYERRKPEREAHMAKIKPVRPAVLMPDSALAQLVGPTPLTRNEVTQKVFIYIRDHDLMDKAQPTMINTDAVLAGICDGLRSVCVYDLAKYISKHLSR